MLERRRVSDVVDDDGNFGRLMDYYEVVERGYKCECIYIILRLRYCFELTGDEIIT